MNKKKEQKKKQGVGDIVEEIAQTVTFEEIPNEGGNTTTVNGPSTVPEVESLENQVVKISKKDLQDAEKLLSKPLTQVQERKKDALKRQLNLEDESNIRKFGAENQRQITELSKRASDSMTTKHLEVVGPQITHVLTEIRKSRGKKRKKGFLSNLIGKVQDKAEEIIEANKTAEQNIQFIEKIIEETAPKSLQDTALLKLIWEKNVEKYEDLKIAIIAGREVLTEKRAQLALESVNIPADNAMLAQQAANKENKLTLFEKRLHDLHISQQLAVLTAVKVNLLEQTNAESLANLQNVAQNVLPIWRQEIAIDAVHQRIRQTADLSKAISDTTNDILKSSAEKTGQLAKDVAIQSQRPIVDVETIRTVSETHLNTIVSVIDIKNEAAQRRVEERAELISLEKELAARMLATHEGENFLTGKKRRRG